MTQWQQFGQRESKNVFFQAHVAIKGNCHRETFWSLFCKMLTVSKNQRIITSGKWLLFAYMDLWNLETDYWKRGANNFRLKILMPKSIWRNAEKVAKWVSSQIVPEVHGLQKYAMVLFGLISRTVCPNDRLTVLGVLTEFYPHIDSGWTVQYWYGAPFAYLDLNLAWNFLLSPRMMMWSAPITNAEDRIR